MTEAMFGVATFIIIHAFRTWQVRGLLCVNHIRIAVESLAISAVLTLVLYLTSLISNGIL